MGNKSTSLNKSSVLSRMLANYISNYYSFLDYPVFANAQLADNRIEFSNILASHIEYLIHQNLPYHSGDNII